MSGSEFILSVELLSDATFGRGDGVAGLVDHEVEQRDGLPFIRGRTLKGLLVEACDDVLYALSLNGLHTPWLACRDELFGQPESALHSEAMFHLGHARLPEAVIDAMQKAILAQDISEEEALNAFTYIRRQSAIDPARGVPLTGSLRSTRVIRKGQVFDADLVFEQPPCEKQLALLSASVLGLRRGGISRNRGRGKLRVRLHNANHDDITKTHFDKFVFAVSGVSAS